MKRVEAIVQSDMAKQVVQAIRDEGVEGITLIQSFGQGQGERPLIGGKQIEFNTTDVIMSVIPDSKVNQVVEKIMSVAHTGSKGDGKIFVSEISNSYDIATKQKDN
ncbi:MAG: P-II family nitrogen regulator [Nitrosopumilus sp.]